MQLLHDMSTKYLNFIHSYRKYLSLRQKKVMVGGALPGYFDMVQGSPWPLFYQCH
jgi:hypothetical protein